MLFQFGGSAEYPRVRGDRQDIPVLPLEISPSPTKLKQSQGGQEFDRGDRNLTEDKFVPFEPYASKKRNNTIPKSPYGWHQAPVSMSSEK